MSRWKSLLQRGMEMIQGAGRGTAPAAESVELLCECGVRVLQQRGAVRRLVPCPRCGARLVVYPVSQYPVPKPLDREETAAPPAEETVPSEASWPTGPPVATPLEPPSPDADAPAPQPSRTPEEVPPEPTVPTGSPPTGPPRPLWRRRTTIAAVITLVVAATVLALVWQAQRSKYHRIVLEQRKVGEQALRDGDLAAAAKAFRLLDEALDWLGHRSEGSYLRHLTDEVLLALDLVDVPPEELFQEVDQPNWERTFEVFYEGKGILFQSTRRAVTDSTVDYDGGLFAPRQRVVWRAQRSSELDRAGHPEEIIAFGRIESVTYDANTGEITVWLAPGSLRLATSIDLLAALGWPVDDQTRALVTQQREAVEQGSGADAPRGQVRWWGTGHNAWAAELRPQDPLAGTLLAHRLHQRADDLVGMHVRIYGKFRSKVGRTTMTLHNCPVRFRLVGDVRVPALARWLYIEGTLFKRGQQFVVEVTSLERAPDPERVFESRAELIDPDDPAALRALADWAYEMARVYDLPRLAILARRARELQLRATLRTDPDKLPNLIDRYRSEVDPDLKRLIRFATYLRRLRKLEEQQTNDPDRWRELAEEIRSGLPPAKEPQRITRGLLEKFQEDPLSHYDQEPGLRDAFDRLLFQQALARYFELRLEQLPPEQWLDLAEQAERELPDRPEVSLSIRRRWVRDIWELVDELDRSQALAAADKIKQWDEDQAREFLRHWLRRREAQLRPDDAIGQLQLARDYSEILSDQKEAARILLSLVAREPRNRQAREMLYALGYRYDQGRWIDPDGKQVLQIEQAPTRRPRSVPSRGDSPETVERLLGGPPTRIARVATAHGVVELWIYDSGGHQLSVRFLVRSGRKLVEAVVTASQ